MNDIITQRTNPNIRFKLQGIFLCEKLNKHLLWKKKADIIYWILILVVRIAFPPNANEVKMITPTSAFI